MDKRRIEYRSLSGTLWGGLSFLFNLAQVILLVPYLLKYWGDYNYGIWLSVFAAYTIIQTIDTGHQAYIGNEINRLYHINKIELRRVLGSSILIAFLLGLFQIFIAFFIIYSGIFAKMLGLVQFEIYSKNLHWGLISLLTMWLFVGSIGGILAKLFIPVGKFSRSQRWGIASRLIQFFCLVTTAFYNGGVFEACLYISISLVIYCLFLFKDLKKTIPEFFPWWEGGEITTGWRNLRKSVILTFNGILTQLNQNGIIILISSILNPAFVPAYTTLRTLANTATQATSIILTPLIPDLVKFSVKKEGEKLNHTLQANWFVSGMLVNITIIILLPYFPNLYKFWTKGILEFNPPLFYLLIWGISIVNYGSGFSAYLNGTNNLAAITTISIAKILITFLGALFFLNFFGITVMGILVVIAEIVSSIGLSFYFVNKQLRVMGNSINKIQQFISLAPVVITGIIFLFSAFYVFNIYLLSYFGLILLFFVYFFQWKFLPNIVKEKFINLLLTKLKFN
ncbi:MAG: lipopolysaccharide biosynthesis protein [Cytophagaceae bacterium]